MRFNVKTGDTKPLRAQLAYVDGGGPINLTGGTVAFHMTGILVGSCTIDDPLNGWVSYPWAAGETATAGVFDAEFQVTLGGKQSRVPSLGYASIHIGPAIP